MAKDPERRKLKHGFTIDMIESLREKGLDPVAEFFKSLALVDDPAIKAKLLLELFDYVYPKRRQVEHTIDASLQVPELSHQDIKSILANDPFLLPAPGKPEGQS